MLKRDHKHTHKRRENKVMLGLDTERMTLADIVATLYRVPMESLADADMATLLDMITEAIK